jgi:hypothetical protein
MQVAALCYCNQYLTDGFMQRPIVKSLLDLTGLGMTWEEVVTALVDAGLWTEVEGGYQIHDYHEYQPTKAQVWAERQQKKAAGKAGGKAAAKARAIAPAQAEPVAESKPDSVPVSVSQRTTPNTSGDFKKFWDEYPVNTSGKKPDKQLALKQWQKLKVVDRERALTAVANYRADCERGTYVKHAHRWLRDHTFMDWQEPGTPRPSPNGIKPNKNRGINEMWGRTE